MGPSSMGKALVAAGPLLAAIGFVIMLSDKAPLLGRLPGDIYWRRGNVRIYFPLTTMLVLSAVATAVVYVVSRLMGHR